MLIILSFICCLSVYFYLSLRIIDNYILTDMELEEKKQISLLEKIVGLDRAIHFEVITDDKREELQHKAECLSSIKQATVHLQDLREYYAETYGIKPNDDREAIAYYKYLTENNIAV